MDKFKVNSKVLTVISVIAIIFGGWLIFSSPARRAEKSLTVAKQLVVSETKELEQFNSDFTAPLNWYKKEYSLPIKALLFSCQEKSAQAKSEIKAAGQASSSKGKRAHADQAQNLIKTISDDLAQARSQLAAFEQITADARQLLHLVEDLMPGVNYYQATAEKRLTSEGPAYLSKYAKANAKKLWESQANLKEVAGLHKSVINLLPADSDQGHLGDPNLAIEFLKVAEENLTTAKSITEEVTKNLDFYREATIQTAASLETSRQKISNTYNYLNSLVAKGPFQPNKALKAAFENVVKADELLLGAKTAAETLTNENKYDLPFAYGESLEALRLANWSTEEADRQVALYTEATKGLTELQLAITNLEGGIANSRTYQSQLNNHSANTWSAVAGNIKTAKHNSDTARNLLAGAQNLVAVDQSYSTALSEIQTGLKLLGQSEGLISSLIQVAKNLESYRASWPQVKRQADSAISNEEDKIDSYGSYDSSAQSDFDSAKSHLSAARSLANSQDYQSAVAEAKNAIRLADGTGDKAYQAYRDHQNRQSASNSFTNSFGSDSFSNSGGSYSSSDYGGGSSSYSGGSSSYSSGSDSGGWSGSSSSSSDGGGW